MLEKPLETQEERSLEDVLQYVRQAVRRQKPYIVGGTRDLPIKLNQNENPFDLPPELKRELVESFMAFPFNRYPAEYPERLQNVLAERLGVSPESLLIENGSNALSYLLGLVLVEQGAPVVLPRPMFSLYAKMVHLFGGDLKEIPALDDLQFDAEGIREAVRTVRPALTIIATPNNPTGLSMPLADVESILRDADGFVVIDEAYVEFNEEGSALPLLDRYPNLIVMRTFSKAAGLAGLRLGYLVARPEVIRELGKARLPFTVDRLAEAAAVFLLERPALMEERLRQMRESTRMLVEGIQAVDGVTTIPSQANFVIFKSQVEPGTLIRRLADAGVLVRDMSGYPELKGYVRVSAGTPDENRVFLLALKDALREEGI